MNYANNLIEKQNLSIIASTLVKPDNEQVKECQHFDNSLSILILQAAITSKDLSVKGNL